MQAQIMLGRVYGIEIDLHRWIIITLLVALLLAGQFYTTTSHWSDSVIPRNRWPYTQTRNEGLGI